MLTTATYCLLLLLPLEIPLARPYNLYLYYRNDVYYYCLLQCRCCCYYYYYFSYYYYTNYELLITLIPRRRRLWTDGTRVMYIYKLRGPYLMNGTVGKWKSETGRRNSPSPRAMRSVTGWGCSWWCGARARSRTTNCRVSSRETDEKRY